MKKNKAIMILTTLGIFAFGSYAASLAADNIPKGWLKAGSTPEAYEVGVDKNLTLNGSKNSTYISSAVDKPDGFATLMQTFSAKKYLGKRIKMSGFVRTDKVGGWTGLWMRIDGKGKDTLGFDNMQNRAIRGTTGWRKYDIVLDVPKSSKYIAFGVLLGGKGKVWMDNITFETVNNTVRTTNMDIMPKEEPVNLNFEN